MASLFARRMLTSRATPLSLRQATARIHSFSGALAPSVHKMKPGGANGFFHTSENMMPEISEMLGDKMTKGVVSINAFSAVPHASSLVSFGVWDSIEAAKEFFSQEKVLSKIYAKVADHIDLSVLPPHEFLEADFVDFGCLHPTGKYQSRVLVVEQHQTRLGGRQQWQELMKRDGLLSSLKDLDFGIEFQIMTYPNETSMVTHTIFQDFDAYKRTRSPEGQKQIGAFMNETGIVEMMTGPGIGKGVVFPEGMVYVH